MLELNRRNLLLGGVTTLVGGAAVPLLTAGPAAAAAPEYAFTAGGDTTTVASYGPNAIGVTWSRQGQIIQQSRFDYARDSNNPKFLTENPNRRGRMLVIPPFNPRQGIFQQSPTSLERVRVNVNGFGYILYDNGNGRTRVRFQVVGAGGQVHTGEMIRGGNDSAGNLLEAFIDQTGQINQQYAQYRNAVGQQGALGGVALGSALAVLLIGGAAPLAILGIAVAFSAASVNTVATIRDRQTTFQSTENAMITTFTRLSRYLGFGEPDIAMYEVGGLRYNQVRQQMRDRPTYPLLGAGSNP